MARVRKKKTTKKAAGTPSEPLVKSGGKGPSPGTLHKQVSVSQDSVDWVAKGVLDRYKKKNNWNFLSLDERESLNKIARALVKRQIVTSTHPRVVRAALIKLDAQGDIDLPPPAGTGSRPSTKPSPRLSRKAETKFP